MNMEQEARRVEALFLLLLISLLVVVFLFWNYNIEITPGVKMNIFELLLKTGR